MKTRSMKTRFLSCAVSFLMVPTLLPAAGLQVYAEPEAPEYLTFTAQEAGTSITLNLYHGALQYSTDAENWSYYTSGTEIALNSVGDSIYLRGRNNDTQLFYGVGRKCVEIDGKAACSGNIMTLVDYEHPNHAQMHDNCFSYMFSGCTGLTAAPELPATTLAGGCYDKMFYGCTGLAAAPELPATTLTAGCYSDMFNGCTGLTAAPKLPATTLADGCYSSMFKGCTGLTAAPELPATTLAESCYAGMFEDCTGLTEAPKLPATTLIRYCYSSMFKDCTGLTEAPKLPATTLADSCYEEMFAGCTGICLSETQAGDYTDEYRVPDTGTGTTANKALSNMFLNTGGTFTGTPQIDTTYYMKSNKLTQPEYKQTAKKNGTYYTRFIFVTPKTEIQGKSKAKFTVTYHNTPYTFETNTYYTGVTSNGVTYVPADGNSVLFVLTVSSGSDISADLTCKLDFE